VLYLDIETSALDGSLVCVGWAEDDGQVVSEHSLPGAVRSRLADADETVVTHTGYDVRFLRELGVPVLCQMHDTQVMAWLVNENTPLDLASLASRYLGEVLDKSLQKKGGIAPWADIAAYCEKDVDVTRRLHAALLEWLKRDDLLTYFDTVEAPFTKVLRDMEEPGLPVDLPATEKLARQFQFDKDKLEAHLTVGLPTGFNVRSHQDVAGFLGTEKFTVDGRVAVADYELEQALAKVAGEGGDPGEGFETDIADVPVGTFVAEKVGRKWAHGYWVVAGIGKGLDPLTTVAKDQIPFPLRPHPWVKEYLEYKQLDKILGTYLDVFLKRGSADGRVRGRFNQTGTVTGRLSSSEPNLQNIPSRGVIGDLVRDLFIGDLIDGDFSQLEPRLMAHWSQDPAMMELFAGGGDIYADIAQAVGCPRQVAKTLVLAMGYGAGAAKLTQVLITQGFEQEAAMTPKMLAELKNHYWVYFEWREKAIARAATDGYVSTLDGRKRRIELSRGGSTWTWKDRGQGERQAANAIVQGSAADVVRRVMLHVTRMFPELRLLAQVHDELLWEYQPPLKPGELERLEQWVLRFAQPGVSVPLVFTPHAGSSWYRAKEGI
jgi:DNA polymerase I-like protein with 3'-5' exonuclease and polymerase domains